MMQPTRKIYYQKSTTNKSFLNMHYFLKDIGIKNNNFMLALLDPDLAGVDPHDKRLNSYMKQKVLRECILNYWYFLREVIRIPVEGSAGVQYELHRGNLALNFCMMYNLNVFLELPRQHYKTVSALCRYLYLFNFGTSNSQISFLNKKMEDAKRNLQDMKDLREMLPTYLRMDQPFAKDGKKLKIPDTVEKLQHPVNRNIIKASPSARSRVAAANLLRGQAIPLFWADEYAFIPYNSVIYLNAAPAFKTAMINAKKHGVPYGLLITTTPGDLTTEEGLSALETRNNATRFTEGWYDKTPEEIQNVINANIKSNYVHILFTYQQLGKSEEWFASICKDMEFKWNEIRREILLEWIVGSDNSPFDKADLDIVKTRVRDPIETISLMGIYPFDVYERIEYRHGIPINPPIIGVDVSGGYKRDASAISCIDSKTTKLFGAMKCNYISPPHLARAIHELVTRYFPNAVVNVERNGGYGASVLATLIKSSVKKNLYYEIKDRVIEETNNGANIIRKTQKTKVYGLDSSKNVRELLIQILRERMTYHKDKFISKLIYEELIGLEVKRNGKIEHSNTTHDDLIFSYLMALYVWYEGKNLRETFGIEKGSIKTEDDIDETLFGFDENIGNISEEILELDSSTHSELHQQLKVLDKAKGILFNDWLKQEEKKDQEALDKFLSTRLGRETYSRQYNIPIEELQQPNRNIPDSVYLGFNDDPEE